MPSISTRLSIMLVALCLVTACTDLTVTPADTAASNLDVLVSVVDAPPSSDEGSFVLMQFKFQGKSALFAEDETITCNGVPLEYTVAAYAGNVPTQPSGGVYEFVYTRGGVPTSLRLPVPPRVEFVSPTQGAFVPRSSNLTITYVAGDGTGATAGAPSPWSTFQGNSQPDNGTYTGFDVSSLSPGSGTISLIREYRGPIAEGGFHSAEQRYDSISTIDVTWN